MFKSLVYSLVAITCLSCGGDDQKSYSKLGDFRVLAIIADSPEINAPQTLNITPYLSYPAGGDTSLTLTYQACLDPGIAFGAEANCDAFPTEQVVSGSATFATSGLGSAAAYTGPGPTLSLAVPASAFAVLQAAGGIKQFNGLNYLVFIEIQDDNNSSQTIKALKRIVLSTKTTGLNTNPTATGGITTSGQAPTAYPAEEIEVLLEGTSAPESYLFLTTDGVETTIEELMTVSWFSNSGSFQFTRVDPARPNTYDPETDTSGILVGVYRDNRGGVTVVQTNL